MITTISLKELKKLCEQYDLFYDEYPESRLEENSVFKFIIKNLKGGEDMKKYRVTFTKVIEADSRENAKLAIIDEVRNELSESELKEEIEVVRV